MKSEFVACVLLLAIFVGTSLMEPTLATSTSTSYADGCDKSCESRCGVAGVKDRCLKYCGICCAKCKCVPSGTYGNKHQCPCYRDLRNSKGKSKCP